ncbi:hypothetical protein HMPREF3196_00761 [Bifidobacterium bifidum]|uniref:Uncharacterized protein n=1 Tax=Bifidobacterium bifidum TaxID=1681 RepID=A0A133KQP0_BIFBI|nr:hypothetical protein HMPREF3196_00761 [Bifidobacterium bifidum]
MTSCYSRHARFRGRDGRRFFGLSQHSAISLIRAWQACWISGRVAVVQGSREVRMTGIAQRQPSVSLCSTAPAGGSGI